MFDVVVISPAGPELAARTFAGLVEGVVDGLVRRAVLLSSQESEGLRRLADAAGCRLEAGIAATGFGEALKAHLETAHVLVFTAGALLPPGWPDLLQHEFQRRGALGPAEGLAFRPTGLGARLRLMAALAGRSRVPLAHGALLPKGALTGRGFDGASAKALGPVQVTQMAVERMVIARG
jgi:hypothetical protein